MCYKFILLFLPSWKFSLKKKISICFSLLNHNSIEPYFLGYGNRPLLFFFFFSEFLFCHILIELKLSIYKQYVMVNLYIESSENKAIQKVFLNHNK